MEEHSPTFTKLIDLASEKLSGKAILCSDDFFAPKENLIKPGRGIFIADKYTDRGKWMDGWESRRKRTPGHDWCIIRLGTKGKISGVDIDTNHFLGNHPPHASLEALNLDEDPNAAFWIDGQALWQPILSKSPLNPGDHNYFEINNDLIFSHIRLNIYPDGGVARLKIYGEVNKDWSRINKDQLIDLASAANGGISLVCNDMFFSAKENLILPDPGINMGDGWETKRNRDPENRDWVIIKLAGRGFIKKAIVDTSHFKGNFPDSCSLDGIDAKNPEIENFDDQETNWKEILPKLKLSADREHIFVQELQNSGPFTHVRLNIFPDGGVSRLRLFGNLA